MFSCGFSQCMANQQWTVQTCVQTSYKLQRCVSCWLVEFFLLAKLPWVLEGQVHKVVQKWTQLSVKLSNAYLGYFCVVGHGGKQSMQHLGCTMISQQKDLPLRLFCFLPVFVVVCVLVTRRSTDCTAVHNCEHETKGCLWAGEYLNQSKVPYKSHLFMAYVVTDSKLWLVGGHRVVLNVCQPNPNKFLTINQQGVNLKRQYFLVQSLTEDQKWVILIYNEEKSVCLSKSIFLLNGLPNQSEIAHGHWELPYAETDKALGSFTHCRVLFV